MLDVESVAKCWMWLTFFFCQKIKRLTLLKYLLFAEPCGKQSIRCALIKKI
jgi:hypothetical protein